MSRPGRFGYGHNSTDDEPGSDYSLYYVTETDQAWGVTNDLWAGATIWLPKSACSYGGPKLERGQAIEIWVPDWLAEQKGLA
jgi:hypothetical protein